MSKEEILLKILKDLGIDTEDVNVQVKKVTKDGIEDSSFDELIKNKSKKGLLSALDGDMEKIVSMHIIDIMKKNDNNELKALKDVLDEIKDCWDILKIFEKDEFEKNPSLINYALLETVGKEGIRQIGILSRHKDVKDPVRIIKLGMDFINDMIKKELN